MMPVIVSIAKKEILDNVRNAWLLTITVIYTALVVLVTYSASNIQSIDSVGVLISSGLSPIVTTLVPIIGLMLGYIAIVGEIESGSLLVLGSHAVSRLDILLGKVLGRGFILVYSIVFGFGLGGIIIAWLLPNADFGEYAIFIGATMLFGLLFFCIGVMLSTLFRRRTLAIGMSLMVWITFVFIWPIVITILLFLVFSNISGSMVDVSDVSFSIPSWLYAVDVINPITEYSRLLSLTITSAGEFSIIPMPDFYSAELMVGLMVGWIVSMLVISWIRFQYTDI